MIYISKAPYRLSLLGGGSDLDWFVNKSECGYTVSYALPVGSTLSLYPLDSTAKSGTLNYSNREVYTRLSDISHPLIRTVFSQFEELPFLNSLATDFPRVDRDLEDHLHS